MHELKDSLHHWKVEKIEVNLQYLTGEGKLGLVWIIENFEKLEGLRNQD